MMRACLPTDAVASPAADDFTSTDWSAYRDRAYTAGRQVVANVRGVLEQVHARRAQSEAEGRVSAHTMQLLHETGLFRAFTPLQWGGLETDPASFYESTMLLATADASAAWVAGQINVHAFEIALMGEAMQREFWGHNPDARASSSYAPIGHTEPVEGGHVLDGTWTFSSGIDHAQWVIVGAGDRNFVVPVQDGSIDHSSWDVQGLKGTGSKSITLKRVFVPQHRTHFLRDTYEDRNPGWALNDRPLYRLSFLSLFNATPPNTAIGLAQAGLDVFLQQSRVRRAKQGTGAPVAGNPFMHLKLAEGLARVGAVRERQLRGWREAFDQACQGRMQPTPERMRMRFEAADSIAASYDTIADVWTIAGAASSASRNPLQHIFRDLMAARNHGSAAREAAAGMYVRTLLGEEPPPFSDFGTLAYYR